MSLDISHTIDSIQDGTKEVAEIAHVRTSEFHEKYVSKVLPDCGKFGDAAKFVAEMAPGVSEYNAIREGDWQAFAISAGIDVTALAIGVFTAGTGYGAVKGGSTVAKAGVKTATREIAEAGAKKVIKETAEAGAEKIVKEAAEAGAEKIVKEAAEAGAEKIVKEAAEAGAEKIIKETAEAGAEKIVKEAAEAGAEKIVKEAAEAGAEKIIKETAEAGAEKIVKEAAETGAEKAVKEIAETGAEKAAKELVEEGTEKIAKETAEEVATRSVKEVGEKIDKKLIPEYLQEVEKITNRDIGPEQMEKLQKALREQDFAKLDPEKAKLHKKLFDNARDKLIEEWEKNTGDKWPVYVNDVLNDAGEVIRKAGQRFDAHHLIESSFGGPNAWWNLHPAAFPKEHQLGIHGVNSLAKIIF